MKIGKTIAFYSNGLGLLRKALQQLTYAMLRQQKEVHLEIERIVAYHSTAINATLKISGNLHI